MINWHKDLYVDDNLIIDKKKIMKRIEKNKITNGVFCITIASNENNLLDIINANELLFDYYKRKSNYIVALASSRKSAIDLVALIVTDVYKKTGGYDVRRYFKV